MYLIATFIVRRFPRLAASIVHVWLDWHGYEMAPQGWISETLRRTY
jgi:hypothetical protein